VVEKLKLLNLDISAFLISAIIHDYKHPGVTNGFLINSKSEIAIRYNGKHQIFINYSKKFILQKKYLTIIRSVGA
jgi:hypothetical protein